MNPDSIVHAFYTAIEKFETSEDWKETIEKAYQHNKWFEPHNTLQSLKQWQWSLQPDHSKVWLNQYDWHGETNLVAGIIMAGNIPLVGFHDFLSAVCAGFKVKAKCSSDDNVLLKFWFSKAIEILPALVERVEFTDNLKGIDVAIATGSNNSARYFEYYFRDIPHVLRKNRNSLAVLTGEETEDELKKLGHDVFDYYGMGCRNVTHLLLPEGYDFRILFESWETFSGIINHNKYANNYHYHRALLLMNLDPHLDNGFVLLKENDQLYSPVGMLNYSYYKTQKDIEDYIAKNNESIQCIVSKMSLNDAFKPGTAQNTTLLDYADGIDTVAFLLNVKSNNP